VSFTVHCLASGSSANSYLVTCEDGGILLDAGLGMRALRRYIEERGIAADQLAGICVTHEHHDHCVGAVPYACRWKVPIIATEGTMLALQSQDAARREPRHTLIPRSGELAVGPFVVRAFPTSHDAAEPCGFRVSWGGSSVCIATDTGIVTPQWRDACIGCSLLIVEANHDLHKLRFGPYPDHLKRRILASTGHLSNHDAAELVLDHTADHGPVTVWFAHLSEVNNTPSMVSGYWNRRWKEVGLGASPAVVEIARRDTPSLLWRAGQRAVQNALF
jgi:phosphoribosyl 1,2-cyclic phosphodiesterase